MTRIGAPDAGSHGRPTEVARLRAARAVWRHRADRRSGGDIAYLVYITLLVALIAGVPVIRTVVLSLAEPAAIALLSHPAVPDVIGALAALLWCGALALGRLRGPIAPPPFTAAVLSRGSIRSRTAWSRSLTGAVIGGALGCGAVAALAVSGLVATGAALPDAGAFIVVATLTGVPAVALWMAGQALPGRRVSGIGVTIAALAVVTLVAPLPLPLSPWALLGAAWPAGASTVTPWISVSVAAGLAVVAAGLLPWLLDRLHPETVVDHSLRWEAMTVLAGTGDVSGAFDRLRTGPSAGRRWRVAMSRPLVLTFLQRDVIGAARTPLRAAAASAALGAAGIGWAWAFAAPGGLHWALALPAGILTFAALGTVTTGFREAADTAGRPSLYRQSAGRLMLLHAPVPLLAATVIPTTAALLAGGGFPAALVAAALGAGILAVRAYDAAKGPLPVSLMMPVPTPVGDASAIGVWAWQLDALLITGLLSIWLGTAAVATPAMLLWIVPSIGILVALTAGRLRRFTHG